MENTYYVDNGKIFQEEIEVFYFKLKSQGFIYILKGLCDALDRYFDFLNFYNETMEKMTNNGSKTLDAVTLRREVENLKDKRDYFENKLNDEIKIFTENYDKMYIKIIEIFENEILKSLTKKELEILK